MSEDLDAMAAELGRKSCTRRANRQNYRLARGPALVLIPSFCVASGMREKSGAGASVSSGASYQARVGAYLIATAFCRADTALPMQGRGPLTKLGFETMEDVDDINLHFNNGSTIYIQAKAIIGFSPSKEGGLKPVLDQFRSQRRKPGDRLLLVTTSRSPRKVTQDLRAALEAYHDTEEDAFYATQPQRLTAIIDEVKTALAATGANTDVVGLLRAMSVIILDIENEDTLEQAMVLVMQANGFIAPSAVWGKLVADCVGFSKTRRVVKVTEVANSYERFLLRPSGPDPDASDELLKLELDGSFAVAREILMCDSDGSVEPFPEGICIIELYRFDDDCDERVGIGADHVSFGNGTKLKLLQRASTFDGMTRVTGRSNALLGDRDVIMMPANITEDLEESPCAEVHRARIDAAIARNETPLLCLHCGTTAFSVAAHVVELGPANDPAVGVVHDQCLLPADRILGTVRNDLFDTHAELIDFDVPGWFKAANGGQMAFAAVEQIAGSGPASILWNDEEREEPFVTHMIEVSLQNGERELVTKRAQVQRFSKADAEAFTARLNSTFMAAHDTNDPYCYSDESKMFAPRSEILAMLGAKEKARPIEAARMLPYDAALAGRISRAGHWYAPLLYLRNAATGEPIVSEGTIFLLTDPLTLKTYLENWRDAGIEIVEYRTDTLLDDRAFDSFMHSNKGRGVGAIVDPLFDPSRNGLASGRPIVPLSSLSERNPASKYP